MEKIMIAMAMSLALDSNEASKPVEKSVQVKTTKQCQCSEQCECGCNEGQPCTCGEVEPSVVRVVARRPQVSNYVQPSYRSQPVYSYTQPTYSYAQPSYTIPVYNQPLASYRQSFRSSTQCGPGG